MHLIVTLILCLLISFLFTKLSKKLNISTTVGLIIAGILIGSSSLKNIILGQNAEFILNFGDFAIVVLMFIAGMEISWSKMYKEKKEALFVALFAFICPFLLGFIAFFLMDFPIKTCFIIGICMSITAEGTKARILMELKKLNTKIGSLMMGAGIIDDIIGIFFFTLICYLFNGAIATKESIMIICVITAFFCGILVHKLMRREIHEMHILEKIMTIFFVPFFFISIGIHFSFNAIAFNPLLVMLIVIIATVGKILGSLATKPFLKVSYKQIYLIGWGMNSRGAVELAIAFIAYKIGLLDIQLYSGLIFMALVTTLIFPFVLRRMIRADDKIMN